MFARSLPTPPTTHMDTVNNRGDSCFDQSTSSGSNPDGSGTLTDASSCLFSSAFSSPTSVRPHPHSPSGSPNNSASESVTL